MAASRDTISQAVVIYVLAFLIPAGSLVHCKAGSSEVLISVVVGEVSLLEYLRGFLLPATLGNTIGGVFLVALLNYGRVAGSSKKTPWPATRKKTNKGALEPVHSAAPRLLTEET